MKVHTIPTATATIIITDDDDTRFDRTVSCTPSHSFQIVFIRNDQLLETPVPVSLHDGIGNCGTDDSSSYCYPWFHEYSSFDYGSRTVVIANLGVSNNSKQSNYQQTIHRFIEEIQDAHRRDDIIFLRTSVPAHAFCDRPHLVPHGNVLGFTQVASEFKKSSRRWKRPATVYNLTLT